MFVLSAIRPPAHGAAFGKSISIDDLPTTAAVARETAWLLSGKPFNVPVGEAKRFALSLVREDHGTQHTHAPTNITFRADSATDAPHPCPCCGRLVLPTDDDAHSHADDALCGGCYTYDGTPQCLPANTAHATTPTEEPA